MQPSVLTRRRPLLSADSMFNNFLSVSAEPGPGSKYFNFTGPPGLSMWNTVIGHDNTYGTFSLFLLPHSCLNLASSACFVQSYLLCAPIWLDNFGVCSQSLPTARSAQGLAGSMLSQVQLPDTVWCGCSGTTSGWNAGQRSQTIPQAMRALGVRGLRRVTSASLGLTPRTGFTLGISMTPASTVRVAGYLALPMAVVWHLH